MEKADLFKYIEENQIGYTKSIPGPYGHRRSEMGGSKRRLVTRFHII